MLLAEGAVDIAAEPELELYDMAALDVIVREAGGRFTSLDGTTGPFGGNALATNGHLHEAALAFLGSVPDGDDPDAAAARAGLGARAPQPPIRPRATTSPRWAEPRLGRALFRTRDAASVRPVAVDDQEVTCASTTCSRAKPSQDVVTITPGRHRPGADRAARRAQRRCADRQRRRHHGRRHRLRARRRPPPPRGRRRPRRHRVATIMTVRRADLRGHRRWSTT